MTKINAQEMMPAPWHHVYVPDLEYLGFHNLDYLKRYWRKEERELAEQIKTVQSQIDTFDGMTIEGARSIAINYAHPTLPANLADGPFDAASLRRKPGETTLNFCGWCKYAEDGTMRNGCNITAACSLIADEFRNGSGFCGTKKFCYNTPCQVTNCSQFTHEINVSGLKAKLERLKSQKARVGDFIALISDATERTERKPCFADWRPFDWFQIGDEVVLFAPHTIETGKVIDGYRRSEGLVKVRVDKKPGPCNGRETYVRACWPEIMWPWELGYLRANPDYLKTWLMLSITQPPFDPEKMMALISSIE